MSRVYEAWRRNDAAMSGQAPRAIETAEPSPTASENAAPSTEAQRTGPTPAMPLFPLRESVQGAEAPVSEAPAARPSPGEAGPRTRDMPFEEMIRDIALDEQRVNL